MTVNGTLSSFYMLVIFRKQFISDETITANTLANQMKSLFVCVRDGVVLLTFFSE